MLAEFQSASIPLNCRPLHVTFSRQFKNICAVPSFLKMLRRIEKVELSNSEIKEMMSTVSYVTLNQMVFRLATAGKEGFEDFCSFVL